MPILGGKVGPQVGKVGPKVAPREPKGPQSSPKASLGTSKKSLKNDPGPHMEERAAREAAGVPSGGKMTPKSMEKLLNLDVEDMQKKASIPPCFSTILGVKRGGTVPKTRVQQDALQKTYYPAIHDII